jgi:hypothetical protein
MARVLGGNGSLDKGALRHAFLLGDERTFDQDPKYAIRLLVDIAIRALLPSSERSDERRAGPRSDRGFAAAARPAAPSRSKVSGIDPEAFG